MEKEEAFPVHESLKIIEGITINKTNKWWSACLLVESFGRRHIAVYLWNKKNDIWKRKQKFMIRDINQWNKIKESIERLLKLL